MQSSGIELQTSISNGAVVSTDARKLFALANREHANVLTAATNAVTHAMAAGDSLIEAKKICARGAWEEWISENCEFGLRTAQMYARFARHRKAIEAKSATGVALLGIRQALKLTAGPRRPAHPAKLLGLPVADIYYRAGVVADSFVVQQIEHSQQHRNHWYVQTHSAASGDTVFDTRPMKLTAWVRGDTDEEIFRLRTEAHFHQPPFNAAPFEPGECGWQICTREAPAIPLIDEALTWSAYVILHWQRKASTWDQAIEMAEREAAAE